MIMIVYINTTNHFKYEHGDLIFQDLDSSPLCDGIEQVTIGFDSLNFSHVGMVTIINNNSYVLEAYNGVDTVNLDDFLKRSPKIIVGRLKQEYKHLIPQAVEEGLKFIGKKYDEEFLLNNNKFYCSELIYEIFYLANNKQDFFNLKPMTYKVNNKTLPIWADYFDGLKQPIPEGQLGINPGGISLSPKINIVYNTIN